VISDQRKGRLWANLGHPRRRRIGGSAPQAAIRGTGASPAPAFSRC